MDSKRAAHVWKVIHRAPVHEPPEPQVEDPSRAYRGDTVTPEQLDQLGDTRKTILDMLGEPAHDRIVGVPLPPTIKQAEIGDRRFRARRPDDDHAPSRCRHAFHLVHHGLSMRRRDVLLDDMDTSRMLLSGTMNVQQDSTPTTSLKMQQDLNDAMKGELPAAWSDPLKEYYKKLAAE